MDFSEIIALDQHDHQQKIYQYAQKQNTQKRKTANKKKYLSIVARMTHSAAQND